MEARRTDDGRNWDSDRPLHRVVVCGAVGFVVTAGTLLGAGSAAAANPLVVDQPVGVVKGEPGQQVEIDPSALDSKVRDAVLLAMPLNFDAANEASERFSQLDPIAVGTADEGSNFYSGAKIAKAAKSRIAGIGLPEDKVDAVTSHFTNLVSLLNGVSVRAKAPEPPSSEPSRPPSSQPSAPSEPSKPTAPSEPSKPSEPPESPTAQPAPPSAPAVAPPPDSIPSSPAMLPTSAPAYGTPPAVTVVPPDFSATPGALPPWAQSRFGAPGASPAPRTLAGPAPEQQSVGEQQEQQQTRDRDREVRAAGAAEALPAPENSRVAWPVVLAVISLSAVTAGLIRTWVLRRG